jgi:PAS domain S-box-containing protein
MIWTGGLDKGCTWVNRAWLEFRGSRLEQEQGAGWTQGIHPEDLSVAVEAYERGFKARDRVAIEYRFRRFDGEYRWMLDSGAPVWGSDGAFAGYIGFCIDITGKKAIEEALRESRSFLEKAQEVAHIGSWVSEMGDTGSLSWSKETHRIFGLSESEFDGRVETFFERVHPEDREPIRQAVQSAVANGGPYSIEHRILRPDGGVRWVHELADIQTDEHRKPLRMIGTVQDITERRALEDQLRHAQKMEAMGRLAGGIAHDFNNLLTAMMGYCDLLRKERLEGEPARGYLEELSKAAERATTLTRQLLTFSRRQVIAPEAVDLGTVVAEMAEILQRLLGEDVILETAVDREAAVVRADRGQMVQVLMNLAVNARDAMPGGGRLRIEIHRRTLGAAEVGEHAGLRPGSYVVLSVADTGIGIDADTRNHLFEPFFTTKGPGKGTGLGLATVYGIVRQSGGAIGVQSEPGMGAAFRILLPLFEGASEKPSARPSAAQPRSRGAETILLVEDEDAVRRMVSENLTRSGYKVLEARNGEEALSIAGRHPDPIHLLLTDVVMPGMRGGEVAARMIVARPEIQVLFMSGYPDDAAFSGNHALPGAELLEKPFTADMLERRIRDMLDRAPESGSAPSERAGESAEPRVFPGR